MLTDEAAEALTRQWQTSMARISTRAARATARVWNELGSWDDIDVARFAQRTEQINRAAKQAAVEATNAYLSTLAERPIAPISADDVPDVTPDPRGPFTAYWRQLSRQEWLDAFQSGKDAAEAAGFDTAVGASRAAAGTWSTRTGIETRGWRRVLSGENCTWCVTVAGQTYKTAESASFGHHHCDCLVVPVL